MQKFVSILRGINVSGQKKILMADLKELYEQLNFRKVSTYIQSGNVVFESNEGTTDEELAETIEQAIYKEYNFDVPVIIRRKYEIKRMVSANPFLKEKNIDLRKLHVTFLSTFPEKENLANIFNYNFPPDRFVISDKEVFLHIPGSYGETKLSNKFFENKLEVNATTRNWNTVLKLAEMTDT